MSDYNQLCRFMSAKRSTSILRYPTGKYGICGSIPIELTHIRPTIGNPGNRDSNTYDSEDDAVKALLSIGCTEFQLNDCSWYKVKS